MHQEILSHEQKQVLPLIKSFYPNFYLAGGTALALQIGHRKSIDFDLFSPKEFSNINLRNKIKKAGFEIDKVLFDEQDQFTVLVEKVKITFLFYPFQVTSSDIGERLQAPGTLTLAAMKAYTLSRRAKWKDYVDLYWITQKYFSLKKIVREAQKVFGNEFNEKIFRESLAYFDDIDYSEEVIFTPEWEVKNKIIQQSLLRLAVKK